MHERIMVELLRPGDLLMWAGRPSLLVAIDGKGTTCVNLTLLSPHALRVFSVGPWNWAYVVTRSSPRHG